MPYVALAEAVDHPLLTADRRLAGASGLRCAVEVLSSTTGPTVRWVADGAGPAPAESRPARVGGSACSEWIEDSRQKLGAEWVPVGGPHHRF